MSADAAPNQADTDTRRKRLATIAAQLALKGFALHATADGYVICKWNLTKHAPDLPAVEQFAAKVGAV